MEITAVKAEDYNSAGEEAIGSEIDLVTWWELGYGTGSWNTTLVQSIIDVYDMYKE